jgi:hypothetical protein
MFRDLKIGLNGMDPAAFVQAVADRLTGGWRRDHDREDATEQSGMPEYFVFTKDGDKELSPVHLFLTQLHEHEDELWLANIISFRRSLSYSQYNAVIDSLLSSGLSAVAAEKGAEIVTTSGEQSIQDLVPPFVAAQLQLFSNAANKATAGTHPLDRERWMQFLVALHRSGSELNVDVLGRWLKEQGWPDDGVDHLTREFEFGIDLLQAAGA